MLHATKIYILTSKHRMQISFSPSLTAGTEVLICPVLFEKKRPQVAKHGKNLQELIRATVKDKHLLSKAGSVFDMQVHAPRLPKSIIFVSLGESDKLKKSTVRNALATGIKMARAKSKKHVALYLPEELDTHARLIGEVLMMANHLVARYKTGKSLEVEKKKILAGLTLITSHKSEVESELKKGMSVGAVVNITRDLINDPPNILSARALAEHARKTSKESGLKCIVFEKKELEKMKMGALLAVNRASTSPEDDARLVVIEHLPNKNEKPIALIGKGIIFDTGGYDLKPSKHMADMQTDMTGAAVVMGVMSLLKKLGIKRNVIGIAAITANLVGPTAYKSSEIITSYSGKTIEITNTDAEGRVVLCDAISYAVKHYKAKQIIDLATLTGACCVALGDRYAGMLGTDKLGMKLMRKVGRSTDDLVWPLPIHPDYEEKMKSKIADLKNTEEGYYAGASKAAAFLKFFVEKTPWIHLDIAGTSYTHDPKKYESILGTGFGVRLVSGYLEAL